MKILLFFLIFVVSVQSQVQSSKNYPYSSLFIKSTAIPDITDIYGTAWADLDGDANPDLYLTSFRGLNRLLLNSNFNLSFTDGTIQTGLGGNLMPRGIINLELGNAIFDWDNDGDQDVLICGWGEATRFFQNEEDLQFTDITDRLNLHGPSDFNDAVVADVNNDGYLDLFFTDEHFKNRLFMNVRGNEYMDISAESGLDYNGVSQTAAFSDVDLDGDQDLYVANWDGEDWIFKNNGEGVFSRLDLNLPTIKNRMSSNSASFGDIDNDGDFDLFVATRKGRNYLYENKLNSLDSSWAFKIVDHHLFQNPASNTYGGNFSDIDLNGKLDLFLTNNGQNQLLMNHSDSGWISINIDAQKQNSLDYSTGSAFADYDMDGDLDLFVANKDTFSVLYENTINNVNFIRVELEGVTSNADAIGSSISLFETGTGKLVAAREINGGTAYLSQNSNEVLFAVDPLVYYHIKVLFPSGKVVQVTDISFGNTYHITEYNFPYKQLHWSLNTIWNSIRSFHFWVQLIKWFLIIGVVTFGSLFVMKKYLIKKTEKRIRSEYLIELENKNEVLKEKHVELEKLFDELKSTQSTLILSEKMASLGRIIAGVAHELNNPISFIYANVHQLRNYTLKIDEIVNKQGQSEDQLINVFKEINELIEDTQRGSQTVKELVQNLRKFSHLDSEEWKNTDIHDGLETSLMILQPLMKKGIDVKREYGEIPSIDCHPGQINQVFLNILTNAVQAVEGRGTITISTSAEKEQIEVAISDDGPGISKTNITKVFDPFFSTKEIGEGTGLGLSISMTIIKNHNGDIAIESDPGAGTTFTILLPRFQAKQGKQK